jgi:hypothetical protein
VFLDAAGRVLAAQRADRALSSSWVTAVGFDEVRGGV